MIIRLCVTSERHDVASHQVVAFVKSEPNHIKLVTTPQSEATHGGVILDEIKADVPKWIGVQIGGAINLCQHATFNHVATLDFLGLCFEDGVYKMCEIRDSNNLIRSNTTSNVAWGRCLDSINEFDGQFRTAFEIQAWHSVGWKPSPIPYMPIPPEPIRLNVFEREQRVNELLLRLGIPENTPLTPLLLQNAEKIEFMPNAFTTIEKLGLLEGDPLIPLLLQNAEKIEFMPNAFTTIEKLGLLEGDPLLEYLIRHADEIPEYFDIGNESTECGLIQSFTDDQYRDWGYNFVNSGETIDGVAQKCADGNAFNDEEPDALKKALWMKFVAESFAEITRRNPTSEAVAILVSYKEAGLIDNFGITASDQDKNEVKAAISRIGFLSISERDRLKTIVDTIRRL